MNHSYKSNKKKKSLRLDPALRAALTLLIPSLLLRVLTAAFAYTWLGVLLQLLMYILCGYMAASAYYESIRREFPRGRPKESVRCGAKSGITLGILLSILLVLLMLVINWLVPVIPWVAAGQVTFIFFIPLDVLAGLFLGAFGGKIST